MIFTKKKKDNKDSQNSTAIPEKYNFDKTNFNFLNVQNEEKSLDNKKNKKENNDRINEKVLKSCKLKKYDSVRLNPNIKGLYVCSNFGKIGKLGKAPDLNMCAYLKNKNGILTSTVYYNSPRHMGIYLIRQDDLNDVSNNNPILNYKNSICIDFQEFPKNISEIYLSIMSYAEDGKPQNFSKLAEFDFDVLNDAGAKLCEYKVSMEKNNNYSLLFGRLIKRNDSWYFQSLEEFSDDNVNSLKERLI